MLRIFFIKWFFCGFIIILQIYAFHATETQNQEQIDKDTPEIIDWVGLLTDLRGSWQSPLSYLQKRGYIPAGNENLLQEKLSELRGMKTEDIKEKSNENVVEEGASISAASTRNMPETEKFNIKPQVASEITDASVSNIAGSEAAGAADNPTAKFIANNRLEIVKDLSTAKGAQNDDPIVTYASQQQLSNDLLEDLYKGLNMDLNADVEKETEQEETEEDADSAENQVSNVKSTGSAKTKSKKNKCKHKSKFKSKNKTSEAKPKPGFFQNLKQKFTSMFQKTDKEAAESKKTAQNKKLSLSPDFASYYVKYLAHRYHDNHDTNSLSLNDVTGQYTSVRYYGDLEIDSGGKGLYRRDYSGKDLTFNDYKIKDTADVTGAANEKNVESKSVSHKKAADSESKYFTLREFPFQDFNLGDIEGMKTKELKSDSNEDVKISDLKNFDSKDEELNAIVHSLAEQQTGDAKSLQAMKGLKSTKKDYFALKGLDLNKEMDKELLDNSANFMTKDFKLKNYTPPLEGVANLAHVGKDTDTAAAKDDYLGDFETPSYNVKNSYSNSYSDLIKHINLKDFDFNLPDLGLKGLATKSNQYIPSTKQFGNLGVPSAKLKAIEADAAATSNLQMEKDSNESSFSGLGSKIRDFGVNDGLSKETAYMRRALDAANKVANANQSSGNAADDQDDDEEEDQKTHVAVKETNTNDFDMRSLSTNFDDSNLELDRQFTRQVLEKVMRDAAHQNKHK
ncbi:uncharacterized protein [Eurosta solidaginis]|uniref:uncharacterized protein n=1 Tax=Eurosta solidaginis TaxID=178769 RepID=UPI00353164CC